MTNPYVSEPAYNSEVYTLPPFVSKRVDPVYEHITNKYYCQESVVSAADQFTSLTWKIQQPDMNMVMRSVKVNIPVKINVLKRDGTQMSPLISDRLAACNIALSSSLQSAFTDINLTLNGKMFNVQPSVYQDVLNKCYTSKDWMAFSDNHSLKPVAVRNLKSNVEIAGVFPVRSANGALLPTGPYVQIAALQSKVSDHAFDISFTNGPFIERVRQFQTNCQGKYDFIADLVFYLEVGPFMARARKRNNVAVPFIRDFALRMLWNRSQSEYDIKHQDVTVAQFPQRVICNGVLEFGTTINLRNVKESPLAAHGWPEGYSIQITKKPFLSINYVKMGDLENQYTLRCLEYRYQKSNFFNLTLPVGRARLNTEPVLARINTRLTSIPSRCYLWAELQDQYKRSFFAGNCQRYCRLEDIHLRINQRTDVVASPTQFELYEQFKLLTNNGLEYPSWAKSPVYVFSSAFMGQPDFLSGDGIVNTFEWDANVVATELQCEEYQMLNNSSSLASMGYRFYENFIAHLNANYTHFNFTDSRYYFDWVPNRGSNAPNGGNVLRLTQGNENLVQDSPSIVLEMSRPRLQDHTDPMNWYTNVSSLDPEFYVAFLAHKVMKLTPAQRPGQSLENIAITRVLRKQYRYDGLWWGILNLANNTLVTINTIKLWYVPESFLFEFERSDVYFDPPDGADDPYADGLRKPIFNSLTELNFNTGVVANPVFITGNVSQYQSNSKQFSNIAPFNRNYQGLPFCPGPRGYPAYNTGISCCGETDGGAGQHAIRGGISCKQWNDGAQTGFSYLPMTGAQAAYRWVAFVGSQDVVTGANGNTYGMGLGSLAQVQGFNQNQAIPNGSGVLCGDNQFENVFTLGHRIMNAGMERHIFTVGIDRALYGTHQTNAFANMVIAGNAPNYRNIGMSYEANDISVVNNTTDELPWELKCLYEYGEQKYLFSADAAPAKIVNNIVLNAKQAVNDPRLPVSYEQFQKPKTLTRTGITYS